MKISANVSEKMLILRMDNKLSIPVATTTQQHYAHLSICLKDVLRTCGDAGVAFSTGQFQFKPTVSNDAINQQQPSAARACPQQQQPPVTSHLTSLVPPVTSPRWCSSDVFLLETLSLV